MDLTVDLQGLQLSPASGRVSLKWLQSLPEVEKFSA
jgi:hypothetical protein